MIRGDRILCAAVAPGEGELEERVGGPITGAEVLPEPLAAELLEIRVSDVLLQEVAHHQSAHGPRNEWILEIVVLNHWIWFMENYHVLYLC